EKQNHWGQKDVICPKNSTSSVLKQCRSAIFDKASGNDRKAQAKEQRQKYCAARSDCEKK
uniref:Uncharacterized protein n=1 Tax=Romanomermis culicivorax TaxID=13658 RepID=A0A915KAR7_ROMCU